MCRNRARLLKNMTFFYDSIVKPFMEEAQLNFLCKGS